MGLTSLILGGAGIAVAAKTGLILKLLLIFKKGIIFLIAGIGAFFRWITGKKKKDTDVVLAGGSTPPPGGDGPPPGGNVPPPSEPPASV